MAAIDIEQAIYGNPDSTGYQLLARSPGFQDEWLSECHRLCSSFGEPPAGISCPPCVFAQPVGKRHVAVVQAAGGATGSGAMAFHLLILPRSHYLDVGGDPFVLAERFPPDWRARGALPPLSWDETPAERKTEDLKQILEQPGAGPTLLGGAQALVDGGRVAFMRSAPDPRPLRNLWSLLPTSTRAELWPASFAFRNELRLDA